MNGFTREQLRQTIDLAVDFIGSHGVDPFGCRDFFGVVGIDAARFELESVVDVGDLARSQPAQTSIRSSSLKLSAMKLSYISH